MYPRLDVQVSRQVIHLLKSPFCIHPGTGNVCVPFDPLKNISGILLMTIMGSIRNQHPIYQIQNELEEWEQNRSDENDSQEKVIVDYEKTSLKPYIDYFAKFVNNLLKEELKGTEKRSREEDPLSFRI